MNIKLKNISLLKISLLCVVFSSETCSSKKKPAIKSAIGEEDEQKIEEQGKREVRRVKAVSAIKLLQEMNNDDYNKFIKEILDGAKASDSTQSALKEIVKREEEKTIDFNNLSPSEIEEFNNVSNNYIDQLKLKEISEIIDPEDGIQKNQINVEQIINELTEYPERLRNDQNEADRKDDLIKEIQNFAKNSSGFAFDYAIMAGMVYPYTENGIEKNNLIRMLQLGIADTALGKAIVENNVNDIKDLYYNRSSSFNPFDSNEVIYYGKLPGNQLFDLTTHSCKNIYEGYKSDKIEITLPFDNANVYADASNTYPPYFSLGAPLNCDYDSIKNKIIIGGGKPGQTVASLLGRDGAGLVPKTP